MLNKECVKEIPTDRLKLELMAIKIDINSNYCLNPLACVEQWSAALARVRAIRDELTARGVKVREAAPQQPVTSDV